MLMKFSTGAFSILMLGIFSGSAIGLETSDEDSRRKTMTGVIGQVGDIPKETIHQWLRDAHRLLGKNFEGVPFWEVVKVAEDLKLPLIEGWENGTAIHRRFKLADSVFELGSGKSADAYLFFSSMNRKDAQMPFVATDIYNASIGLLIDVGMPYEAVIERGVFPANSALRRSLDLDEVAKSGGLWPYLKRMTVSYDILFNRWLEEHPSGFHLDIEFAASLKKKIGSKRISCSILSGLDPPQDFYGKPTEKKHKPKDSLGEPRTHGGSEGWHGEDDEIAANKAAYLRPPKN